MKSKAPKGAFDLYMIGMHPRKAVAIGGGGGIGMVAEEFFEKVGFFIAQLHGDLRNGQVGGLQEIFGVV